MTTPPTRREPIVLALLALAATALSAVDPFDRLTWWLEAAPVLLGVPLAALTWRRFPLSPLLVRLLFVHGLILIVGAHYTYAEVPLGHWLRDTFDLARNPYDRIGHLAQGFVPAILARELLLRTSPLQRGRWLFGLVVAVCLAFSAFYELTEWWAALLGDEAAASFLGTQGDVWDTQWDMALALFGAVTSQLLLARVHDRSMASIGVDEGAG